ncbi:TolC family protein, partial [Sphingomonas bacterium]|uniref:TolC family protein n=1 Tax=Sphingomonas bacterium TaxID=1895847 RepID=UPI0015763B04
MLILAATLGGCMVGPHYQGPPEVAPAAKGAAAYRRANVAPVTPAPPLARWWLALNDDTLNRIEDDALAHSPTLERAVGVVREARASVRERASALLPQGGANVTYAHIEAPSSITDAIGGATGSGTGGGSGSNFQIPQDIYNVGLLATWEIDLFGRTRRQIAAARDTLQADEAQLDDARVTLTKDVATAYVNLRDAQDRLALAKANTAVQQRMLDLTRRRRQGGTATDSDVERVFAQLKQTEATAVPIAGQVEIYTDQLSQLAGHEPGTLDAAVAAS